MKVTPFGPNDTFETHHDNQHEEVGQEIIDYKIQQKSTTTCQLKSVS